MNEEQANRYLAAQKYMEPFWKWHRGMRINLEVAHEATEIKRYHVAVEKVTSCIRDTKKLIAALDKTS